MGQGAAGSLCEVAATGKQREKHEVLGLISAHGMQYSFTAPQSSLLTELDVTEESPAVTCMSSSLLPLIFLALQKVLNKLLQMLSQPYRADTVSQFWWICLGPDVMLKGSLCFGEEDFRALVQNSWGGSNHTEKMVLKLVHNPAGKGKHLPRAAL